MSFDRENDNVTEVSVFPLCSMLCCVSRRNLSGSDRGPPYDHCSSKELPVESEKVVEVEQYTEPDEQHILLPCAICARTFKPQSLEKHSRICERQASKKRKPFDSAKQRIQGTELAEFLPKQEKKRYVLEDRLVKPKSAWKQKHDDFLRAIRAARNEIAGTTMQKQCGTMVISSAPTRSNEQGMCPTCNRHFGVKAYDRHVAWCKDRVTRMPVSPATNIAKERLEARMKYRAPAVKNRRQVTREKYSPGSVIALNTASKTSPPLVTIKAKESISVPSCNKSESPIKQKSLTRRSGHTKESHISHVPMKLRPIDRPNRQPEEKPGPLSIRPAPPVKRISYLPVPPLKHTKSIVRESDSIPSPTQYKKQERSRKMQEKVKSKQEEKHSARSPKMNIVSARSQGNPKVNDVSINADIVGVTVKPCNIYRENAFTTWKKISEEKSHEPGSNKKYINVQKPLRDTDLNVKELSLDTESFEQDALKVDEDISLSARSENLNWLKISSNLNQTYSFKDLTSEEIDLMEDTKKKWKSVKHSPRVEFCLGNPEKVNRARTATFGFIYPDESIVKKVSCTSSKTDIIERKRSKNSVIENGRSENEAKDSNFDTLNTKMPTILDKKQLTPTANTDLSPRNKYKLKTVNSQENLEKNNILDDELNSSPIEERNTEIVDTLENNEENKENSFPKIDEVVDDNTSEGKQLTVLYERLNKVMIDPDSIKVDNDDLNSEVKNLDQSLQNETEYSTKTDYMDEFQETCDIEDNLIETESYPFSEDILLPTGSSTPFLEVEEYPVPKSELYETSMEESCQVPDNFEWKMAVDVDTRSEVLYRVESRDSSRSKDSKLNSSGNRVPLNSSENIEDCSYLPSISNIPSAKMHKKEIESYSRGQSPATLKQEQFDSNKPLKKETASQINICNCSSNIFTAPKCEKVVDSNNLVKKEHQETEESVKGEIEADSSFEKVLDEQLNEDLEDISDCKPEYADATNDNYLGKESNEEIQEIYKNYRTKDFDEDSDNSVEQHMKEAINNLKASANRFDRQNVRSIILSESCLKVKRSSTTSKSYRSRTLDKDMNVLNESSDSLASSINGVDFTEARRVESVEVETIEEIGTRNRNVSFKMLPEIRGTMVRQHYGEREKIEAQTYWEKASRATKNRLINLDPPYQGASRFLKRNPKVRILPPVPSGSSLVDHRNFKLPLRPVWSNYVRRRPDFNLVLSGRTGKDYDPFLLAEQQMNDLLSDTSEQSVTDSPTAKNRETSFPLSHSSAFVKYPCQSSLSSPEKRSSLIAPPTEFDDLVSDISSDSTETNSLSREIFLKEPISRSDADKKSPVKELGRRVIIDKSKALGGEVVDEGDRGSRSFVASSERARKILDKVSPKVIRPSVNRSLSVRASSAPKTTPDRKTLDESKKSRKSNEAQNGLNNRNDNYANLSNSNLSLSSIVSSDMDIKRSNSLFDELMTSFEDENGSFSSLKSLLKNNSLSSPLHGKQRNGQISDEELSSPESYKRQDHSKLSADSAYSSLNRKYSHHGRSTTDVAGRLEEDLPRRNRRDGDGITNTAKCKMSKYCHECGSKFPETAKFCCECGFKRLVL